MATIVILGPAHPLRGGGMSTFNERMAREFIKNGHQVKIYTFSLQYPWFLFPGKSQYSDEPKPDDLDIYVKVNSINPFNWIRVGHELRKIKPDYLIIRYWMPFMAPCLGTIAGIVSKNKHTRIVAIADNVIPHERHPGDMLLTRYFVNKAHKLVVMSESVQKDLRKFSVPQERITRCLHPLYDNYGDKVDKAAARKKLGLPEEGHIVLFFGFIRHYKGLDLLIKAFSNEKLRAKNVSLLIAGEFYTDPKFYFNLAEKLGLNDKIIWHNQFISNDLVRYYFSACDLVAQPYKHATQSGVTQIAYHFEVPMLVTQVGGLPEMVPHMKAGYVVEVNHHAIAHAMADYFDNNRRGELMQGLKVQKQAFSWAKFTEKVLQ